VSTDIRKGFREMSWESFGIFSASGIISMIIAQFFYYEALKDKEVTRLFPVLFGGTPVITMILGCLILGEKVTILSGVGGALIIAGSIMMLI
ncbi:EamA family transporter, partial [bacterium]|nr:EamA family transporter [bacterium]